MEMFAKWSAIIVSLLRMFTHQVIASHVSTKSGIVHSVQKKKVSLQAGTV